MMNTVRKLVDLAAHDATSTNEAIAAIRRVKIKLEKNPDLGNHFSALGQGHHIEYLFDQKRSLEDENERLKARVRQLENDLTRAQYTASGRTLEQRNEEIRQAFLNGKTREQLRETYGLGRTQLYKILKPVA